MQRRSRGGNFSRGGGAKFVSGLRCVTCASTEICSENKVLQTKIELMSPIESYCQPFYETIKLQIIVSDGK